jgi:hypothetical protein
MKLQGMNPRLRELVALVVLAAFGCGLALSQGDLLLWNWNLKQAEIR